MKVGAWQGIQICAGGLIYKCVIKIMSMICMLYNNNNNNNNNNMCNYAST